MKKFLLVVLISFAAININAQIKTLNLKVNNSIKDEIGLVVKYDSLNNHVGDNVYSYVGQDLYLKGINRKLRSVLDGYSDFYYDYEKGDFEFSNIYKLLRSVDQEVKFRVKKGAKSYSNSTIVDSLYNKEFRVLDIFKHPRFDETVYNDHYFIKLFEEVQGDTLYYEYSDYTKSGLGSNFFRIKNLSDKKSKKLLNSFEKSEKLIGQKLIVREDISNYYKLSQLFLYDFNISNNIISNIYNPNLIHLREKIKKEFKQPKTRRTPYDSVVGRYFKVLNVYRNPKYDKNKDIDDLTNNIYGNEFYLKLVEKKSKDTLFYKYNSRFEHSFPFVVVGYYEMLKKKFEGKELICDSYYSGRNIKTGESDFYKKGEVIRVKNVIIEQDWYKIVLISENLDKKELALELNNFIKIKSRFTVEEIKKMKKVYGIEAYELIEQRKVQIGMTARECKLSWGEPIKINSTITNYSKSEQWVYDNGNYLYFDDDKLTAIQN